MRNKLKNLKERILRSEIVLNAIVNLLDKKGIMSQDEIQLQIFADQQDNEDEE